MAQNNYEILAELALHYTLRNDFQSSYITFVKYFALVDIESNIRINPYHNHNSLMYYNFGVVCNRLGRTEEALKNLNNALNTVDFAFQYADNLNGSVLMMNIVNLEKSLKGNR